MRREILKQIEYKGCPQEGYIARFTRRDIWNPFSDKSLFKLEFEQPDGRKSIERVAVGYSKDVKLREIGITKEKTLYAEIDCLVRLDEQKPFVHTFYFHIPPKQDLSQESSTEDLSSTHSPASYQKFTLGSGFSLN